MTVRVCQEKECNTQGKIFKTRIMRVRVILRCVDSRMVSSTEDFKEGRFHGLKDNLSWDSNVEAILKIE